MAHPRVDERAGADRDLPALSLSRQCRAPTAEAISGTKPKKKMPIAAKSMPGRYRGGRPRRAPGPLRGPGAAGDTAMQPHPPRRRKKLPVTADPLKNPMGSGAGGCLYLYREVRPPRHGDRHVHACFVTIRDSVRRGLAQPGGFPRFITPSAETDASARHHAESVRNQPPDHALLPMTASSRFRAPPVIYLSSCPDRRNGPLSIYDTAICFEGTGTRKKHSDDR